MHDTIWQPAMTQLIQVTLVTIVIGIVARLTVNTRPHLAHGLLLVVLLKCVTPPIASVPFAVWWSATTPSPPIAQAAVAPTDPPAIDTVSTAEPKMAVAAAAPEGTRISIARSKISLSTWLFIGWILGTVMFAGTLMRQWLSVRRQWRRATAMPCHGALERKTRQLSRILGIRRSVEIVVSPQGHGPLVTGWLRPKIVLPACLVARSNHRELTLVIAHELVHVRRGDTLVGLLQGVAQAVWWFHPAVWWTNRWLDHACEQCCDDEVIASLRCEPARYANCLVGIVELKHNLRHVIGLPGTRPRGITARRLARLGRPVRSFARRAPWYYWLVFVVAGGVLLPAHRSASAPRRADHAASQAHPLPATADNMNEDRAFKALRSGEWGVAIKAYRDKVDANPRDALAWYRLGYALHAAGQLDAAIDAHQHAAQYPATKPIALYNLACAYSLRNDIPRALETLEQALDSGFRPMTPIEDDPDLVALAGHVTFMELAERSRTAARTQHHPELDFLVGAWEVHDVAGRRLGYSDISKDEEGFLLTEKWKAANGTTGTGITYFDPGTQQWRQTFVGMFGNVTQMEGHFVKGELMMDGETTFLSGKQAMNESVTTRLPQGQFRFILRESRDGGESWQEAFNGIYSPSASGP